MKIAARTVHVHGAAHGHEDRVFQPGDKIPKWAEDLISNPKVFATEEEAPVLSAEAEANDATAVEWDRPDYTGLKVDELRALLEERNLETSGVKSDLIQRLEDDDDAVG